MSKDRLGKLINFAEGLKKDPQGEDLLKGAIENVERMLDRGEMVEKTLKSLKMVERLFRLIPKNGKERNN